MRRGRCWATLSILICSLPDAVTSGILSSLAEGLAPLHSGLQAPKGGLPTAVVEGGVSLSKHKGGGESEERSKQVFLAFNNHAYLWPMGS